MEPGNRTAITIATTVAAPLQTVWALFTQPQHITQWNSASEDWHTPHAENDLRVGGTFRSRMEAKDGSFGFDFEGVYDDVKDEQYIEYTMGDGRKVSVRFSSAGPETTIEETFEPEETNSEEMQKNGWQAILDSFRRYTENHILEKGR